MHSNSNDEKKMSFVLLLECLAENDCSNQDTKKKCNTADGNCVGNGSTIIDVH